MDSIVLKLMTDGIPLWPIVMLLWVGGRWVMFKAEAIINDPELA